MLLVRIVRGATLHKLHGNISVWSHNFCNTPWIKVGNTTNVKSYLIDRIRPVDLVLLQNLFFPTLPDPEFDRSTTNKVHLVLFGFVWCFALWMKNRTTG